MADGHAQRVKQVVASGVTPGQVTSSLRPVLPAMKGAIALLAVCAVALVLLIVHSVVQEVGLHHLKTHKAATEAALDDKEAFIVATKQEVEQLKISTEAENTKTSELNKRQEEIKNAKKESEEKLKTCNSEKARGGLCCSLALGSVVSKH